MEKIKSTVNTHGTSLASLANNPLIIKHLTTNFEHLSPPLTPPAQNAADTVIQQYWVTKAFLDAFEPVVSETLGGAVPDEFMCVTRFNLSTRVTEADASLSNVTMFGTYRNRTTGKLSVRWMDYKNGKSIMNADATKSAQGYSLTSPSPLPAAPLLDPSFKNHLSSRDPYLRCYTNVVNTTFETGTVSCYQSFWSKAGEGAETNQPDGACRFTMTTEFGFTNSMDAIGGDISKAIMLFDSNFNVVSASVQNLDFPGNRTTLPLRIASGTKLSVMMTLGSPSAIPSAGPILYDQTFGTTTFVYSAIAFNVTRSDKWVVCSLALRQEIYGKIEEANRRAMLVVVLVAVGVFLTTGVGMWGLAVRPLRRLAVAMEKLSVFDFATLEKGDLLNVQSLVREIYVIQETFSIMVKAFAGGIRSNRSLQKQTQSPGTTFQIFSSKKTTDKPLSSSVSESMPLTTISTTASNGTTFTSE
ncbi:hypothetical protein HK102_000504 [Quaeritorhiza haematococci]|nr:hypothetical protein HK102_000504 [Quaeritorhiza haematococci]